MKNSDDSQVKFYWLGEWFKGTCHFKTKLNDGTTVYMCSKANQTSGTMYPIKRNYVEL